VQLKKLQKERYKEICDIAKQKGGICLAIKYTNAKTKLPFKCSEEEHPVWYALPQNILRGSWCNKCVVRTKISEKAKKEFFEIVNNHEGEVIGNYINTRTSILVKCKFDHQWKATPNSIKCNS